MNILFQYLYRDAGNFKNWGEVVFYNKKDYEVSYLEKQIKEILIDKEFFVAEKADVPKLQFPEYVKSLDHEWHEFHSISVTSVKSNDKLARDIEEFIESLKYASTI